MTEPGEFSQCWCGVNFLTSSDARFLDDCRDFAVFANEIQLSDQPLETRKFAAYVIARVAAQYNPHFDFQKFMDACRQISDTDEVWKVYRL